MTFLCFFFSDESDQGWRSRQPLTRPSEANTRRMQTNDMNEASMSSAVSSQDDPVVSVVECQKSTQKESSPPNIFNNTSSLKYLHKKFKRVASAIIEDNCEKIKTNINVNKSAENTLKCNSASRQNLNGESSATIVQSHINESKTNSQEFIGKCMHCQMLTDDQRHKFCEKCNPELTNATAKYGYGVQRNEFHIRNGDANFGAVAATSTTIQTNKQYESDLKESPNKSKNDCLIRVVTVSPLQQKTNYEYESSTVEDFRTKSIQIASSVPQNFKENSIKGAQHDHSVQYPNPNACSKVIGGGAGSVSVANKRLARRKSSDRPYPCTTCGIEFKSRSQYYKHCRFVI